MACQWPVLSLASVVLFVSVMSSTTGNLYNDAVNVKEVNVTDFYSVLTGKDYIWVINYYKHWCGHCQRYAPIFSDFAKDIIGWNSVVRIAVIDCAVTENLDVCRANDVKLYPAVKFLPACATREDKGQLWKTIKTVDSMRHQTIEFLKSAKASRCTSELPWPSLDATSASSLDELRGQADRIILVLENEESYLGTELILDYSSSRTTKVFRVLPSNRALFAELKALGTPGEYATLYVIREGSATLEILAKASVAEGARELFKDALYNEQPTTESWQDVTTTTHRPLADPTKAYQVDLDNALNVALLHEVPVHESLNETQLIVLRHFVDTLAEYFPASPEELQFLRRLRIYLWDAEPGIRGQDVSDFVRKLSTVGIGLPPQREYEGCRGSLPHTRGFPCSLWMLFHAVTVDAFEAYKAGRTADPLDVLRSIKDFVHHYFTCRECAKNFAEESRNMEQETNNPEDTVLWLWSVHNQVNARLAGDKTEDPERPKVQFPPPELCPSCRKLGRWDEEEVLTFLQSFYGRYNLVQT